MKFTCMPALSQNTAAKFNWQFQKLFKTKLLRSVQEIGMSMVVHCYYVNFLHKVNSQLHLSINVFKVNCYLGETVIYITITVKLNSNFSVAHRYGVEF